MLLFYAILCYVVMLCCYVMLLCYVIMLLCYVMLFYVIILYYIMYFLNFSFCTKFQILSHCVLEVSSGIDRNFQILVPNGPTEEKTTTSQTVLFINVFI